MFILEPCVNKPVSISPVKVSQTPSLGNPAAAAAAQPWRDPLWDRGTHIQSLNPYVPNHKRPDIRRPPVNQYIIDNVHFSRPARPVAIAPIDIRSVRPVVVLVVLQRDGARWQIAFRGYA